MSLKRVFLTGGSGYVGKALLRELGRIDGLEVVALDRSGALRPQDAPVTVVRGDLLAPESYAHALRGCDAVIHLAAATGKASAATQERDTAKGTEALLEASRAAGIERFLFVSSIAAAFTDTRGYPYAAAKRDAERAVVASGIPYSIVRPTMIFGEGAPVLTPLARLALLPVVVVPGTGSVRIQPISVDDVVRAIVFILRSDRFQSEIFELGGPETLRMDDLLQRIRIARKGTRGSTIRIPLGLLQPPLAVAEAMGLRSLLPATAAQLSSFKNDGVAEANPVQQEIARDLTPLDAMIGSSTTVDGDTHSIDAECAVFTRHLLDRGPDAGVVGSYADAVRTLPSLQATGAWERSLLSIARTGTIGAQCADAFAALFARRSVLRKRLVMLLAILETRAPFSGHVDESLGSGPFTAVLRVALRGTGSLACAAIGALWVVPVWMVAAVRGR